MDKMKYLARLEDDNIAQGVFAELTKTKANHHKEQIGMMRQVLDQVVISKEKKAQEEQVKKEMKAFDDDQTPEVVPDQKEEFSSPRVQDQGVFTV